MRVDEHTIEVAGSPVFYRSASTRGTPVLYLHGIPTSSDDFLPFLERSGGIAPDLIGFGRSTKAGNLDYTLEAQADFVQELLGALELDRVQLVVHDWGAAGGLIFAQRHPERIERLVICNALPLLPDFGWHRQGRLWRRPALGELAMGSVNRWLLARALRRGSVRADAWPQERIEAIWEQFDQGTQRAILRLHRDAAEQRLAGAGAELERLRMPALVIWGEADPWFAPAYGEAYASRLGDAELRLIPDAGHWPWLDQPSVIELVAAFLS